MQGRKRKSEHQLTRDVSSVCDKSQTSHTMATVSDLSSTLWNWFRSIILQETAVPSIDLVRLGASKTLIKPSTEDVTTRPNTLNENLIKPQKHHEIKPILSRSRPEVDLFSKENHDMIDVSECNVNQAREKIDQFWEPKPMPWVKHHQSIDPPLLAPETQQNFESKPNSQDGSKEVSGQVPESSMFNLSLQLLRSEKLVAYRPHSHDSHHGSFDIKESLENLLLDSTKQLAISDYKKAKNLLRIKERDERLRQDALDQARERRLRRIYPKKRLIPFLDPQWEERVNRAYYTKGENILTTSICGTELRIKDFRTLLDPRAWLNDEIINTYIEWIVDAANTATQKEYLSFGLKLESLPKFIAHNSFFYETLRKRGPASLTRLMKRKGAPGALLLDVDTVFVPICNGTHWTLGVVRPIAKTIEYFDSMGGSSSTFVSYMQEWLAYQLGEAYSIEEWTTPETASANQTNGYDCGVFVCTNAFCVAMGLDTTCYQESDMTRQRKNIAAVLLNRGFTGDFAWK